MAKTAVDNNALLRLQKQIENVPPFALQGELQKALALAKKDKKNPVVHFALGMIQARAGDFISSVSNLKTALKLTNTQDVILGALALVCSSGLKDYSQALKCLKKKTSLNKKDGAAYMMMANCHMQLREPDKALEMLELAELYFPNKLNIHGMRSSCFLRMGDSKGARKEYMAIRELDPTGIAAVGDMIAALPDNTQEQLSSLQSELANALDNTPEKFRDDTHRGMSFTALGNIMEKLGDHEKAFEYFTKANNIQPVDQNAYSFRQTKEFDTQHAVFTEEFFEQAGKTGDASTKQVFVVGMPRSGTTLIESILAAHSKIEDFGELEYFNQQLHHIAITSAPEMSFEKRVKTVKEALKNAVHGGFSQIGQQYTQMHRFDKSPGIMKVDKMPLNFRALGLISLTFPNAKIIHARRHPIDTCLSVFKNPLRGYNTTFANQLETLGEFYLEYTKLMRHWQDVLPINIHEVRYEGMVSDTETNAKAMIASLDLEWEATCLENRKNKRDVNTASMWQVRQDIYNTSIEKWRIYEKQLQPLVEILSGEIELYNNA